jgi:superfamily II DNA/RNA helicase
MCNTSKKRKRTTDTSTNYHGMLTQLDNLIQQKRIIQSMGDNIPEQRKKKQKLLHNGEIYHITSKHGLKIDSLQDLNPFLRKALKEGMKFTYLLPIQHETLPYALSGKDLIVNSQTGSGKTLAYLIPCLNNMIRGNFKPQYGTGVIVIVPTRELALQVHEVCKKLLDVLILENGQKSVITVGSLVSKQEFSDDIKLFHETGGINIIIATPGRLLKNLQENNLFKYKNLRAVIIDECDKLLELGFKSELESIMAILPTKRQTMMFSATVTNEAYEIAKTVMRSNSITITDETEYEDQQNNPKRIEQILVYPLELKLVYLFTILQLHADRVRKLNEKLAKKNNQYKKISKRVIVFFAMRSSVDYHFKLFEILSEKHCQNIQFVALHVSKISMINNHDNKGTT